jgi:hypothetical protein
LTDPSSTHVGRRFLSAFLSSLFPRIAYDVKDLMALAPLTCCIPKILATIAQVNFLATKFGNLLRGLFKTNFKKNFTRKVLEEL